MSHAAGAMEGGAGGRWEEQGREGGGGKEEEGRWGGMGGGMGGGEVGGRWGGDGEETYFFFFKCPKTGIFRPRIFFFFKVQGLGCFAHVRKGGMRTHEFRMNHAALSINRL